MSDLCYRDGLRILKFHRSYLKHYLSKIIHMDIFFKLSYKMQRRKEGSHCASRSPGINAILP